MAIRRGKREAHDSGDAGKQAGEGLLGIRIAGRHREEQAGLRREAITLSVDKKHRDGRADLPDAGRCCFTRQTSPKQTDGCRSLIAPALRRIGHSWLDCTGHIDGVESA